MIESLTAIFNRVEREGQIPSQWRETSIKSLFKGGGSKEKIQERQRVIFITNIVSKAYEIVKKIQNEAIQSNMSNTQTAGKKSRSAMDNIIIINAIIEKQRQSHKNTYLFFADAEKCFDKLWLKDCLIDMEEIGYNRNDIKILYEMNKKAEIIVDTTVGQTESISIKEIVKQGSIFGPIMCCATTSRVNNIGETVQYSYGKVDIGMSVYMDDIAAAGGITEIWKGMRNCAKMEKEKKMRYGPKKTKYMMVKTGKEREEIVQEKVKSGAVQKTETYHYLGITLNEEDNLEEYIKVIAKKYETISSELDAIGANNQVGKEEIRFKLKLFDTCPMTALTYEIESWANIRSVEMREIEKKQGKALKRIFQLPVSITYTGIIMETGIWPAEQKSNMLQ